MQATRLLDTGADEAFDRLARLARSVLRVPFAFVTIVDESRSFWKSCVGVDATDLADRQNAVEESFCQYVIDIDDALIVGDARSNPLTRSNPSIEKMGVLAWAGFPVRSIDGQALGTFCVVDTVTRDWTADEVEILGSLAAAVEGEIRLRTLLDQNAAAADTTHREMLVREHLAKLAEKLTVAHTTDGVSAAITELGPEVLGAAIMSLGILDESRRQLNIRGPVADDDMLGARFRTVLLTEDLPIVDAVRTGQAVHLRNLEAITDRYPHLREPVEALGLAATTSVPLLRSDDTVLGALTVGWADPNEFSINDRALLRTVSLICAQSIERAQVGDLRRELVESLQHELLPATPIVAGIDTAVRYIPATNGIGFGGDWYDIIDLDDGRAVVVVGDVAGHGIEAAARMSQVRGAINALARMYTDDLPSVFVQAELMLGHLNDGYIATVVIFVIEPRTGEMSYISAGHPAALVVERNGVSRLLEDGRCPVLGSGRERRLAGHTVLPEGAVLFAFTDGLVERRDQTTDIGTERLVTVVANAVHGPDFCAETLADLIAVEMIGDRVVTDDVALVVVQRHTLND